MLFCGCSTPSRELSLLLTPLCMSVCRYGVGMAVGFAAVIIIKKAVRSLPVVGGVAKPLLGGWLQQQGMRGAQGCCCEASSCQTR